LEVLNASAYQFGAVVVDAAHFVPQSRPRLFIIAVKKHPFPADLTADGPIKWWHPKALVESCNLLPKPLKSDWVWWRLPLPPNRSKSLASIIEVETREMAWHTAEETKRLLSQMSNHNLRKVRQAQAIGKRVIGTVYRRTRREQSGKNVQRAEVRFDQVSGCLRTPAGGSSRQLILVVEGDTIRSRLLAAREAARLMGVPDSYILPDNYNEAYHLMGDGLAVPVVSWLGTQLLAPLAVSIVKQGFLKAA
ncbi:MAG: DNA cytosine methyltransferase, partial [Nitrospinaceae bacterium]